MAIYSIQAKIAAAEDYCKGHLGLREVAKRHRVNVASLRLWAAAYRIHGAAGVRTKRRKFYSAEFKLAVLQRRPCGHSRRPGALRGRRLPRT